MAATPYEKKEYVPSDAVTKAQQALQEQLNQKPGAYQSQWQQQLQDTMNQILNREKFNYDLNGDALYQQYKDQYLTQGKMAMMDTMGQAQAMTGGYGNSYAQSVGQQTYQGYLQGLNDKIPELYQLALSQYQLEGDALANRASLLAQQEDRDYGRYQDTLSRYEAELARLQGVYDSERSYDYSRFTDDQAFDYGKYIDELNYQYQLDRDKTEDQRWMEQWLYQQERDKIADEQWNREFEEAKRQYDEQMALQQSKRSSGGGSSGGSSGGSKGSSSGSSEPTQSSYKAISTVAQNGASSKDVEAVIAEELVAGNLTQTEAQDLRLKYTDRSNSIWYR